jgi:hypothetical protein
MVSRRAAFSCLASLLLPAFSTGADARGGNRKYWAAKRKQQPEDSEAVHRKTSHSCTAKSETDIATCTKSGKSARECRKDTKTTVVPCGETPSSKQRKGRTSH